MHKIIPALALASLSLPLAAAEAAPDNAELYRIIQAQQAVLDEMKADDSQDDTFVGGYGELHYNDLDSGAEMDFHRFVLFFGHDFSESLRFYSELELEHAFIEDESECEFMVPAGGLNAGDEVECEGASSHGEVELEQAYVELDLNETTRLKTGVFLMPVGILNETHEPPAFYGVERNPIENEIVPATWWEGGALLSGRLGDGGLSYDLGVHSGLAMDDEFEIHESRQKVSEAIAEDLAFSGRLKYTGIAGLELATSFVHETDPTQGAVPGTNGATLIEAHARWNSGPFTLTTLYADWTIDSDIAEAIERDQQDGYYVEGSWRFTEKFGVFARHNVWDTGGIGDTEMTQTNVGFNYWPHPNVVFKFDLQDQGEKLDNDGFNLGVGYQF